MIKHNSGLFHLETKNSSYVFYENNWLQNLYWGSKIHGEDLTYLIKKREHSSFDPNINLEREEYCFWTGISDLESCLKINYPEIRKLDMKYLGHEIETVNLQLERLTFRYKNSYSDLYAALVYDVYADYDIISRYARINNQGDNVIIENLKSGTAVIPQLPDYRVKYLTGKWAGEFQVNDQYLTTGSFTMQSRCGNTGPHFNPAFALDGGTADELTGDVWFGLLGYSGNWQITIERSVFNNMRVTGGISNFDFTYTLKSGESITTPPMYFGFSGEGYGGMSRKLHLFETEQIVKKREYGRVLYNSWEATGFDVQAAGQKTLAKQAARMGIELFVIDDGWFGERHSDHAGLGDWYVNKDKFPEGLTDFIQYVKSLGMDFGIWVEPEAVNPDSALYRAHPDWIYRFKDQEPFQARNQYTLNISKPEVKEFIIEFMTSLLESNKNITFIKWDMNKILTDVSQGNTTEDKELWFKHIQALYEIWKLLTDKFPHVEFEACAGGGSRVDLGILEYASQCWPSDNTDAYERLFIQEGFSYFYAPAVMTCWVTDASSNNPRKYERPYSYRFHSSMSGVLGIGADISKFSEDTVMEFKEYIAAYKEIRKTVQFGTQYRLSSVRTSSLHGVEYISKDEKEVVVFIFHQGSRFGSPNQNLYLQGLKADALYRIEGTEEKIHGSTKVHGSTLMKAGLETGLWGDFDSRLIRLTQIQ